MKESFDIQELEKQASELVAMLTEVKNALEGDSNDAEHDALVSVAQFFDLPWSNAGL